MVNLNNRDSELGMLTGKVVMSGSCTDVIGGAMTAGTFDGDGSGLITFSPFVSAPVIQATIQAGLGGGGAVLTASNYLISLTGATVSNVYVSSQEGSGCVVGLTLIGLQKI